MDNVEQLQSKTDKMKGLKAQMRFREKVLQQKASDRDHYLFSKSIASSDNGKKRRIECSVDELVAKVKMLVEESFTLPNVPNEGTTLLLGKLVKHKFQEKKGRHKWYDGKVLSQVKTFVVDAHSTC